MKTDLDVDLSWGLNVLIPPPPHPGHQQLPCGRKPPGRQSCRGGERAEVQCVELGGLGSMGAEELSLTVYLAHTALSSIQPVSPGNATDLTTTRVRGRGGRSRRFEPRCHRWELSITSCFPSSSSSSSSSPPPPPLCTVSLSALQPGDKCVMPGEERDASSRMMGHAFFLSVFVYGNIRSNAKVPVRDVDGENLRVLTCRDLDPGCLTSSELTLSETRGRELVSICRRSCFFSGMSAGACFQQRRPNGRGPGTSESSCSAVPHKSGESNPCIWQGHILPT
ncbi:unnamed protein product [Pleuronectes platessa]|uniref:Uncharacterized protein n=1 Tax=Pleuronectes platessa TaxID=8262 RepID=A0A9N7Y5L0_PLEPL|nr:unnamed protein product [Pleuronectes platessa]